MHGDISQLKCGTCKFWGTDKDIGEKYRECQGVKMDHHTISEGPVPNYFNEMETEEILELRRTALAVTVDGSGYYAAIKSKQDFGCVLHQEKE